MKLYVTLTGPLQGVLACFKDPKTPQKEILSNREHYKNFSKTEIFTCKSWIFDKRDPILTVNGNIQKFENSHHFKPISKPEKDNNKSDSFKKAGVFKLLEDPI